MADFHVFQMKQMVPNHAKHRKFRWIFKKLARNDFQVDLDFSIEAFKMMDIQ